MWDIKQWANKSCNCSNICPAAPAHNEHLTTTFPLMHCQQISGAVQLRSRAGLRKVKKDIIWSNKENNVFKDALGVKGLGFKHHGNHPCNHGSHYGNHHGNYHDNHSNHHGNYHAEQLLFSCQCSKVTLSLSRSLALTLSHSLTIYMLNNFCLHVYAKK